MAVASQGHSLEPTVGEEGTLSRKPTMVVSDPDASRTVETFGVVREQNALLSDTGADPGPPKTLPDGKLERRHWI